MEAARRSIGTELEWRRLAHRAARIHQALAAMRRLGGEREVAPAPLRHGMSDFHSELERVERRLRELGHGGPAGGSRVR